MDLQVWYTEGMISRYSAHGLTWVDLENPTSEEIVHVTETYHVPALLAQELATSTLHSKVDFYENFIYLVFHFPPSAHNDTQSTDQEIDIIVGKNVLITAHYEKIHSIQKIASGFETSFIQRARHEHAGFWFIELVTELYRHSLHKLDETTVALDTFEIKLFKGAEEEMVRSLSLIGRKLLDFKRAFRFHPDILRSYRSASEKLFGADYLYYTDMLTSEFTKVQSILQSNRETLAELQKTNDSLLSTKQNTIMKKFTILSFVGLPLMLVTGIFGMNTSDNLLFIQTQQDFFAVIGAMALSSLVMFVFFKFNKWL